MWRIEGIYLNFDATHPGPAILCGELRVFTLILNATQPAPVTSARYPSVSCDIQRVIRRGEFGDDERANSKDINKSLAPHLIAQLLSIV